METMTQSAPIIGTVSAGLLAQTVAGPWWLPLVIQLISLGIGYIQGRKAEVRKSDSFNLMKAAQAPAEQHGGTLLPDDDDQT